MRKPTREFVFFLGLFLVALIAYGIAHRLDQVMCR